MTQIVQKKYGILISIYWLLLIPLIGQEDFVQATESLVVLQDSASLLPLRDIEQLDIQVLTIGLGKSSPFFKSLQKYTLVSGMESEGEPIDVGLKPAGRRLQIIGVNRQKDWSVIEEKALSLAIEQSKKRETIIVLFGKGLEGEMHHELFDHGHSLIYAPSSNALFQSLAAQLIFGGIGTSARLEEDLWHRFKVGDGLSRDGGLRLAYAPSDVAVLDGDLLHDSISAIAHSAIAAGAFPGMQVLIARKGKVIFHQTYGYHTYDSLRSVQANDLYDFASLSKITTALPALMQLHGQQRFDLDAPLKRYFPDFRKSNKADLSFRTMLAHHARLQPWIPYWRSTLRKNGRYKWRTFKTKKSKRFPIKVTDQLWLHRHYRKKIYKAIEESPLNKEGGYTYSGLLFYLLPDIVSRLSQSDFEYYLKTEIYHPIGAYTLTYHPLRYFPENRIIPTERDTFFRHVQIHGQVHDEGAAMMGGVSANAGLFGSANDLAKLLQLYLNSGHYGGRQLISEASLREFTRHQYAEEGNRRGLGFDKPLIEYDAAKSSVAKSASQESYGHSGYTGTFCWIDPEYDLIYIFFSNRVFPTRENRLIYQLNIRPRIHQVIYDAMKDQEKE